MPEPNHIKTHAIPDIPAGIQLDDVRCYGDEESILDCDHADWGRHNCDDREAAGVFCTPKSVVRSGR